MKKIVGGLIVFIYILGANAGIASAAVTNQSVAVPAYEYPTLPLWDDIESAGPAIPWATANPNSGPGVSTNPDYTAQINRNTANGTRTIGYLDTNYQSRPIADVIADVELWRTLYPGSTGFFLDRIDDASAAQICYLSTVYNYIKATKPNDLVLDNFGTHLIDSVEGYGDIFVTEEDDGAVYMSTWTMPSTGFESIAANQNRMFHILYNVGAGAYPAVLAKTQASNAGWVYITDDVFPNPYDGAVSYWNTLISDVGNLPAAQIPNRGPSNVPAGCVDLQAVASVSQGAVTDTTSAATAQFTVENDAAALQTAYTSTKVVLQLPVGVTLASNTGSNWTCANGTCSYSSNLAPGQQASVLGVTLNATCAFTGTQVGYQVQGYNQQTFNSGNLAVVRPNCPAGTLAQTGDSATMVTLLAGSVTSLSVVALSIRKFRTLR